MSKLPQTVKLVPNEIVYFNDNSYRITEILDFNTAVAVDLVTGRSQALNINKLTAAPKTRNEVVEIADIADSDWKLMNERYSYIKPLLEMNYGRSDVETRAKQVGKSFPTLYRYLKKYKEAGGIEGLLPQRPGVPKGTRRIAPEAESIVKEVIDEIYLSKQRSSIEKVVQEVRRRCYEREISDIPHSNTIRARVAEVSNFDRIHKRRGRDKALAKYQPVPGNYVADYPLQVVQIDHTKVDLILVDDVYRKPIGRPWITLAIDVYSRMVTGYHLAFDAPSATSVAMCVAHSVLPKDDWMRLHGVKEDWPVWGIMDSVHVDNGADFRSESFRNACKLNSIQLDYRPVKQPRFGGHIERLLGTLMKEVHDLPGTTFSSIRERDNYDSDKKAVMTISEFEKWLVTFITKIYHKRLHSQIGLPPEKKWETGIFGNHEIIGSGPRAIPTDSLNFLISFLPMSYRTVQAYGISYNGVNYYSDTLRHWINSNDTEDNTKKRKFVVRQDPRDISSVWFYDPDLNQYFEIPYANQNLPPMSIWEFNLAKDQAKKEASGTVNEYQILKAYKELREIVDKSAATTKRARRTKQNAARHSKKITPITPSQNKSSIQEQKLVSDDLLSDDIELDGFGDIA